MLIYDRHATPVMKVKEYEEKGYAIVDVKDGQRVKEHDVWTYVRDKSLNILNSQAKERVGYPTQKPRKLLERIISASSNPGGMVLDPFCGCATACVAAEIGQREWAGIDISIKAYDLVRERLRREVVIGDKHNPSLLGKVIHRKDIPQRTDIGELPAYNSLDNKRQLYGEQGGNCAGCKTHFEARHLEVDHIIASAAGGTDHIDNLQLLCSNCNRIKGDRGQAYLIARLNQ